MKTEERTWRASGGWRYNDRDQGVYNGTVTRTYQYKPTPAEVRLDLQADATQENGQNVTVGRIYVHEVLTALIFEA